MVCGITDGRVRHSWIACGLVLCSITPTVVAAQDPDTEDPSRANGAPFSIELELDAQLLNPAASSDELGEPSTRAGGAPPLPSRRPENAAVEAPSRSTAAPSSELPRLADETISREVITRPPILDRDIDARPPDPLIAQSDADLTNVTGEPGNPGDEVIALRGGRGFRLIFAPRSAEITDAAGALLTGLVQRMVDNDRQRLQVRAYARGNADGASIARRLSLERALTVRGFLVDRGVPETRIDIRALGNASVDGPEDRVDLVFLD